MNRAFVILIVIISLICVYYYEDKKDFNINNNSTFIDGNWSSLIDGLFKYNYTEQFEHNEMSLIINGTRIDFVIFGVTVMLGMKRAPWKDGTLDSMKSRIPSKIEDITFNITFRYLPNGEEYDVDGGIKQLLSLTKTKNQYEKGEPDIWIYITPLPFIARDEDEEDLDIQFKLRNKINYEKIMKKRLDMYPPMIDGMINGKEVSKIEAYGPCECKGDIPWKRYETYSMYIYFEDGSNIMYWGGGPKITFEEIESKGYLPYIKQYCSNHEKLEKSDKLCKLTRYIGKGKWLNYRW